MKLITKINLNFLSSAMVVLFVGGTAFYFLVQYIAVQHVDIQLRAVYRDSQHQIDSLAELPQPLTLQGNMVQIDRIVTHKKTDTYTDTLIANSEWTRGHYRRLETYQDRSNFGYRIRIHKSLLLADELVVQLMFGLALIMTLFLLTFFFLNRYVAISSLSDFFTTLQSIRHFKMSDTQALTLPDTDIDELEQLNSILREMMSKLRADYFNLKEFTENASHEIQTPLAIINTQVEQLIQKENIDEDTLKPLSTILEASSRLSKLNKGLLLLAKIENRQFDGIAAIDLSQLIDLQLENLSDFWEEAQLEISRNYESLYQPQIHPYLAELLVFNLLKNAIKHNRHGGQIHIELLQTELRISNTGSHNEAADSRIFDRFVKGAGSKSLGLGLAIVRKICELYQIDACYSYHAQLHQISIQFQPEKPNDNNVVL